MSKSKFALKISLFLGMFFLVLASCYRMPGKDDYSLIPATNNPDVCGDKGEAGIMPGAGF